MVFWVVLRVFQAFGAASPVGSDAPRIAGCRSLSHGPFYFEVQGATPQSQPLRCRNLREKLWALREPGTQAKTFLVPQAVAVEPAQASASRAQCWVGGAMVATFFATCQPCTNELVNGVVQLPLGLEMDVSTSGSVKDTLGLFEQ